MIRAKAVADGWGLYKLNASGTSLETVFMRLTAGDNEAHVDAEDAA